MKIVQKPEQCSCSSYISILVFLIWNFGMIFCKDFGYDCHIKYRIHAFNEKYT
uniref:Uncharacterized protein n=1 Tax=Anguilla anguilla TaxID=7936 RepID=A0A0E9S7C6_ANGAN